VPRSYEPSSIRFASFTERLLACRQGKNCKPAMEETLMATYSAKLVDRAGWSEADKHGIESKAQKLFDEAFQGTPDGVSVSWGDGTTSDNLVVHFVPDIPHSYLKQKWPQARIDPRAIGHTYTGDRPLAGTEVYQTARGSRFPWKMYAITIFHEAMHNLFPYQSTDFVHKLDGGDDAAGMAAAEYSLKSELTQHNKELIRQGFSVKNPQLL
jgi:hypothetical protein